MRVRRPRLALGIWGVQNGHVRGIDSSNSEHTLIEIESTHAACQVVLEGRARADRMDLASTYHSKRESVSYCHPFLYFSTVMFFFLYWLPPDSNASKND